MCVSVLVCRTYRYDVAKLLGVDPKEQPEILEAILSELPSDEGWNLEVAVQRGYAKAGLKRYKIDHSLLAENRRSEGQKDMMSATTEKVSRESWLNEGSSSSAGGGVAVKIEHASHLTLLQKVKVLRSAEKVVGTLMAQLKKDRASLLAKANEAGPRLK